MKNLQTSIVVEETWVEKQTEKLQSLPTATSARELDVSRHNLIVRFYYYFVFLSDDKSCLLFKIDLRLKSRIVEINILDK